MKNQVILKKGHFVCVEFLDHVIKPKSEDRSARPMRIMASGFVTKVTKKHIEIAHWLPLGEDRETTEQNSEKASIIRSTIIKIYMAEFVAEYSAPHTMQ